MERGGREGGAEGKERKREEAETARFGSTTRLTLRRRPGRLRGCRSTLLLGHPYPHPYPRGWIEAGRPIFRAPLDSSSPLVAALSPSRVTSHPPAVVRAYVHTRNAAPCRRTISHKRSIRGDGEENRRERIPDKGRPFPLLSPPARGRQTDPESKPEETGIGGASQTRSSDIAARDEATSQKRYGKKWQERERERERKVDRIFVRDRVSGRGIE